jgi:hypothetical protein
MSQPTDEDLAVAYECLRRVPYDVSPVVHVGRIIARYRERLQADAPGDSSGLWTALGDADHG